MARRKKDSLSAFSAALGDLGINNTMSQEETSNLDNIFDDTDIDDLDEIDDQTSTIVDNGTEDNGDTRDQFEDDTEIPDDILNDNNKSAQTEVTDDEQNNDQVDPNETAQIGLFFDAFAEELGWDVDDDNRPNSVSGLVDYIGAMIEQNSTPQYADERIAQLDTYVKNGGRFEDFYQSQQQSMSYDNMDMQDESNQRAAVREYLKYQGYNDDQISRKIERYEDSDMLEEEAEDAVTRLRSITEAKLAEQQRQQEEARQAQEQQAREMMQNLTSNINNLESIRGIAIPKADRRELFDYITKVDADGLTRYQKDFSKNYVNNLIESAYFTMKGDTLLGEAKRSGRTSAANKLRTMLRHQSTNHSRYNVNDNQQRSVVDLASQFYN